MNQIREFMIFLHDEISVTFWISIMTYAEFAKQQLNARANFVAMSGLSLESQDDQLMLTLNKDPNDPTARLFIGVKQGYARNISERNGKLTSELGKMLIVQIYTFWEDRYRRLIEDELGYTGTGEKMQIDIFGDLRNLRNNIVHHKGVVDKKSESNILLKWFKEGDFVEIDQDKFETIISEVVKAMYNLADKHGIPGKISPIPTFWIKTIFDRH